MIDANIRVFPLLSLNFSNTKVNKYAKFCDFLSSIRFQTCYTLHSAEGTIRYRNDDKTEICSKKQYLNILFIFIQT